MIDAVTRNRNQMFAYPRDVADDGTPFLFIGAYNFVPLLDADTYRENITNAEGREYLKTFAFYIPKSLKYSYNPSIEAVSARIDRNLISGLQTMDPRLMAKGAVATGVNFLALDQNGSMLGQALKLFKDYRQVTQGQIMDPKQLNMFKDAPFMSFNLNYKIIPETLTEAADVDLALRQLRMLSQASMADTQSLKRFLGLSDDLSGESLKMEQADTDKRTQETLNEKIDAAARDFKSWQQSQPDPTKATFADYKKNKGIKDGQITKDFSGFRYVHPDNADKWKPSDAEKEIQNRAQSLAPLDHVTASYNQIKTGFDTFKQTLSEAYDALMNATFDVWNHPKLFDLYVVVPGTESSDGGVVSIGSNREMDMFKYAKGLIISNLEISMIESPNRDDVPFREYGYPIGYDLSITFTSTSKMVMAGKGK